MVNPNSGDSIGTEASYTEGTHTVEEGGREGENPPEAKIGMLGRELEQSLGKFGDP